MEYFRSMIYLNASFESILIGSEENIVRIPIILSEDENSSQDKSEYEDVDDLIKYESANPNSDFEFP